MKRRTNLMRVSLKSREDFVIIGGGFYGCCLALYLSSISNRITLIERENDLMNRASKVNQARVHAGFHYPRSTMTAVKSMILSKQFISDFPDAIIDNFQMLYALPSTKSKISAKRFWRTYSEMGAPINIASPKYKKFFNKSNIEAIFECVEPAFEYTKLRDPLKERLDANGVKVILNQEAIQIKESSNDALVLLADGGGIQAEQVFNVTYGNINTILIKSNLPKLKVKYELAEMAIVRPPENLKNIGITIMDGPFFSIMPYPSLGEHSMTHVRYTPRETWLDKDVDQKQYDITKKFRKNTNYKYMYKDALRYVPSIEDCKYLHSLFEIKTVLLKNETDDGRPIQITRSPDKGRVVSILGGKIDNIYDLFEYVNHNLKYKDATTKNLIKSLY